MPLMKLAHTLTKPKKRQGDDCPSMLPPRLVQPPILPQRNAFLHLFSVKRFLVKQLKLVGLLRTKTGK